MLTIPDSKNSEAPRYVGTTYYRGLEYVFQNEKFLNGFSTEVLWDAEIC